MAIVEKNLTGYVSAGAVTGLLKASEGLTGHLDTGKGVSSDDYNRLINKPKINGVVLASDRSFEELGEHTLTNDEILEIFNKAGG
ncbi:MAG: hypothetical protein ACI4J0_04990 [Huintestinicola sp.]|uniref:hypothetical protein n=1 Tax=Huintestinicola sp. TaxID=2981661 RepID=UPI003EFE4CB5